ncbi:MAG: ATP-binding protein [Planctomycetota bacterium]|nr:ATP-binding protein [Planctomycetota bacterium]
MKSLSHIYHPADTRADELFHQQFTANALRTDHMFAVLMIIQWLAAITISLVLTPLNWNGSESQIHDHVWLSVIFGGVLAALPIFLVWRMPGQAVTRQVIAVAQMLFSGLLIHVSGGRIETHFHIFGSLAFLAFYRDWSVLIPATLVVAADHYIRGVYWPSTVFGITNPSHWRWAEHASWVIYEDIFLIVACRYSVRDMWDSAARTAQLERINLEIENQAVELRRAYTANQAIVETALDAVVRMDNQGTITAWNPQAETTFGYSAAEAVGHSVAELIVPVGLRDAHRAGVQNYLESGTSRLMRQRTEQTAMRRDGTEFPVEIAIAPIVSDDTITFCAFIRDITDRLEAGRELKNAMQASEASSKSKSAFLANMSHEIRTPLNGILGFADLLLKRIDGDKEERRDYLQTIHDSGRHLLTIINDVLDLSKIESGQLEVESLQCSPHEIIASTISILRVRAQERGINLEYFWKSEIPELIYTDPARLRQILMNLVGNAIKFTEVGSVQVAARLEPGNNPHIVIDVIDTGVGIEEGALDRIFDPFTQADTSITRRFGGSGLGLSISRRLAKLLHGELTVTSEFGRGSIFRLRIPTGPLEGVRLALGPAADVIRAHAHADRRDPSKLPDCRILLVEDGVTNRKLIKLVLEKAGADVTCAENGRAGVTVACSEPFDLILMDMQMPIMDGYAAARELRRLGYSMPIVALTAHAMAGDEAKCREAGCSGYLSKPIVPNRLLEVVSEELKHCTEVASRENTTRCELTLQSSLPMDDADFREIVEEFVVRLDEQLVALRAAWNRKDETEFAQIVHWIKGSGGTAGFESITTAAALLERCIRQGDTEDYEQHIEGLEDLLRQIRIPVGAN